LLEEEKRRSRGEVSKKIGEQKKEYKEYIIEKRPFGKRVNQLGEGIEKE